MSYIFHVDPPAIADTGDELAIQIRMRKAIKERLRETEFVAIPNGGERSAWAGIKAKNEGMKAGFPDAIVLWEGDCAFVEVKTATGSLSTNQIDWLNRLTRRGHHAGCFRSVDSLIAWLIARGAPASCLAAAA